MLVCAGGGEIDGRVTRADWREHHLHVSALIADDNLFCEHLKRVWGCGGKTEEQVDHDPSNGQNHSISSSGSSLRANTKNRGPSGSSIRGHQEDASALVERNSDGNNTALHGNGCATSPGPALTGAREAWGPPPPPQRVSNGEKGPILRRGSASASARDGPAATRLAMPPGVLGLLARARGSLATAGMRTAFQLLKGFREEDRRGNGKVPLSGFKKAIGGSLPGFKEAEMRILFQVCMNVFHKIKPGLLFRGLKRISWAPFQPILSSGRGKLDQEYWLLPYAQRAVASSLPKLHYSFWLKVVE